MIDFTRITQMITNHLTLFHIEIFAIITAICGALCLMAMMIFRWQYTVKIKKHVEDIGESGIAIENTKLTKRYGLFTKLAIICFAISCISLLIYSSIFSTARKYGAYGNFEQQNNLTEIQNNIKFGFIDQSKELPEDPKGSVIIFYKWGCIDCENIHDELLSKLTEYNLYKTYFVSSRSEKGKELLEQFPMDSVPSGIYIRYDTESNGYQGYVLNDGTKLNEYNLDTLLSVQTYIRCFELPEEYQNDAIDELPEEYRDTEPTTE